MTKHRKCHLANRNHQCRSPAEDQNILFKDQLLCWFLVACVYLFCISVVVVVFSVLFTDPVYDDDYIFKADILPKAV